MRCKAGASRPPARPPLTGSAAARPRPSRQPLARAPRALMPSPRPPPPQGSRLPAATPPGLPGAEARAGRRRPVCPQARRGAGRRREGRGVGGATARVGGETERGAGLLREGGERTRGAGQGRLREGREWAWWWGEGAGSGRGLEGGARHVPDSRHPGSARGPRTLRPALRTPVPARLSKALPRQARAAATSPFSSDFPTLPGPRRIHPP